jgi:hypothetical protein
MNLPNFTAEASTYRSRHIYSASLSGTNHWETDQTIVPSYRPGKETLDSCYSCTEDGCSGALADCYAGAGLACIFPPACAAAVGLCWIGYGLCLARCVAPWIGPCCPKPCTVPDPFDPGSGCCDAGETCVSEGDPNARRGCCPSDRSVCGGKCCAAGERCCGNSCCPNPCCGDECCPFSNNHCCGDTCCEANIPCCGNTCCSLLPPPGPPPTPPPHSCTPGSAPCGFPDSSGVIRTCCPPGLQCCNYSAQFGPDCRTSCLH